MKAALLLLTIGLVACASSPSSSSSSEGSGASSSSSGSSSGASSSSGGGAGGGGSGGGGGAPSAFVLTSSAFVDGGDLPAEYTCDGVGHSPPLAWSGAPAETTEYALLMTTLAKDGLKWNWVHYGIPGSVMSLDVGQTNVGHFGLTSDGPNLAYSPPCSQGPGAKIYTFTAYALSGSPVLPADPKLVTGAVLTTAIEPLTLASDSISVSYTRP